MRIIAGKHRGRRFRSPEGETTRPITDRVKQSLFDRLAAADCIEGAAVLDLFAGTGSLGLECLSRGAEHVTFVESDRSAARLLEENLRMLGEDRNGRVMVTNALSGALAMMLPRKNYSLVFADPPYPMVHDEMQAGRLWKQLDAMAVVCKADAQLILREEKHEVAPQLQQWTEPASFRYGSMNLHFYRRAAAASAESTDA